MTIAMVGTINGFAEATVIKKGTAKKDSPWWRVLAG